MQYFRLFKMVHDSGSMKRGSKDAKISACLYIACRQEGIQIIAQKIMWTLDNITIILHFSDVPRTFKEIVAVSTVGKKAIGRSFKLIKEMLDTNFDTIQTSDFMSRFCGNLGLKHDVLKAAMTIAKRAVDLDLVSGRSPISVAAAAIYMASQASENKKSKKDISEVAGVATSTILQSYQLMKPRAAELFPDNFQFDTPIILLPGY